MTDAPRAEACSKNFFEACINFLMVSSIEKGDGGGGLSQGGDGEGGRRRELHTKSDVQLKIFTKEVNI